MRRFRAAFPVLFGKFLFLGTFFEFNMSFVCCRQSDEVGASGALLARRQVLARASHDQEALWSTAHTAKEARVLSRHDLVTLLIYLFLTLMFTRSCAQSQ